MLGESIRSFSARMKTAPEAKIWIAGPSDSGCDSGCQGGNCAAKDKGGGGLSGLFAPKVDKSPTAHATLAFEVFSNYLTQRKKARVVESHRHNYATSLETDTHKKIEIKDDKGDKTSTVSCEDLCLLDEAKKRKADKVLAYYISEMSSNELIIHFRLSDVPTGLVEAAQTIKVKDLQAADWSYGTGLGGGGRAVQSSGGGD
jgi:hypothetical protein